MKTCRRFDIAIEPLIDAEAPQRCTSDRFGTITRVTTAIGQLRAGETERSERCGPQKRTGPYRQRYSRIINIQSSIDDQFYQITDPTLGSKTINSAISSPRLIAVNRLGRLMPRRKIDRALARWRRGLRHVQPIRSVGPGRQSTTPFCAKYASSLLQLRRCVCRVGLLLRQQKIFGEFAHPCGDRDRPLPPEYGRRK
jgi:hypothetical protein